MLKIMYGILPFDSQRLLGDMQNHDELKKLVGCSYQEHAIINVKFISDTTDGLIFSALITNNQEVNYPAFSGRIGLMFIDERCRRFMTTKPPKPKAKTHTLLKIPKLNRKKYRINGGEQLKSNAERKRIRKEHNLTINESNWKQFVRKRRTVINLFINNMENMENREVTTLNEPTYLLSLNQSASS